MGQRGPIPNRDNDLARARSRKGGEAQQPATRGRLLPVTIPDPDPDWSPVTMMAYRSLLSSGMSDFYQDSDWTYAWIVLSELDAYRSPVPLRRKDPETGKYEDVIDAETGEVVAYRKLSGQTFQAIMSALVSLGMTEGDRRRMRIELQEEKDSEASAELIAIDGYRQALEEGDD